MLIYRVQHKEKGAGPYINDIMYNGTKFDVLDHCENETYRNCPEPDQDNLLKCNVQKRFGVNWLHISALLNDYIFAFNTPEQIVKWFSSIGIMNMQKAGFDVVVKDITDDNIIIGDSQCVVEKTIWADSESIGTWIPKKFRGTRNAIA